MHHPFFPNVVFAWVFFGTLLATLAAAAVIDIRTTRIPKTLTLTTAGLGLIANTARGAWLGSMGVETWELGTGPALLGAVDGFLFSVVGLLFAFIVFFGMFFLNACGGGDVKLCAAIGAWIGAVYTIFLLFATVGALVIWITLKMLRGGAPAIKQARSARQAVSKMVAKGKPVGELPRGRMTFSLPAAVATAVVMLWVFRVDLGLAPAPQAPANEANHATVAMPTS
jgi:prepilin peptidase CpaA